MGMAASQARLLTITARLADNELKSQTINNAKMRLATQSSQASNDYINALNEANLMFSNYDSTGAEQSQLLTFNSLTSYSSYNNQYGLVNAAGQLYVSESEADIFEASGGNLNNYLKSHGLVYDTTYFDELEDIDNKGVYPDPYNTITTDTLKEWYKEYNSYENSQEQELYTQKYDAFTSATNKLQAAISSGFGKYVQLTCSNLVQDSTNNEWSVNGLDSSDVSIFGTNNVSSSKLSSVLNTYFNKTNFSQTFLNGMNTDYMTEDTKEYIQKLFSNLSSVANVATNSGDTTATTNAGLRIDQSASISIDTTSKQIMLDGETSDYAIKYSYDETTKIYTITLPSDYTETDATNNTTSTTKYAANNGLSSTSLATLISGISVTDSYVDGNDSSNNTTTTKYYKATGSDINNLEVSSHYYLTTANEVAEYLNSLADTVYSYITTGDAINLDKFTQDIINSNLTNSAGTKLTDANMTTIKSEKYKDIALSEYITNYQKSKDDYINFIFSGGASTIDNLLINGTITAKDLADADSVLKLVAQNSGLTIADAYNTIIQDMFVSKQIESTGEPKYAWIDENDTGNTGNADAKAQWYTNLFNRMSKGYKKLEDGLASSSQWIEYALESGIATMEQVDKNYTWNSLDYKSCAKITEETDNSDAVTKAEAEYNRAMNDIEAKDSIYDIQLKNIDTEHSALQTEYDSIKNALNKNIERTFKFSSNG